ncbi:MAG: hypothetical protein AAGA48_23375 [Myxococcota bacterium]
MLRVMAEEPHDSSWPSWRAALIAGVLLVHCTLAAPLPHVITDAELKTPTAREEIRRWTERLSAVGLDMEPVVFGKRVQAVSSAIGRTHNALKRPYRPIGKLTGTGQGWALFANPNLHPHRFNVRVAKGEGPFEDRYLQLDPEHDWWRARLRYRRVRGCWDTVLGLRLSQKRFGRWLANTIFEAEPDVTRVQTRMIRTHTNVPGQRPSARPTRPRQVLTFRREDAP